MKKSRSSFRFVLAVAVALPAAAGVMFACSDDDTVAAPVDGGLDSGDASLVDVVADRVTPPDGGPADTGPDTLEGPDANDGAAIFCPIIGPGESQADYGSRACNACVRTWCCAAASACLAGDVDGSSTLNTDGGISDCNRRIICTLDCLSSLDGGGCERECDKNFPAAANAKEKAFVNCIWEAGPAPSGCRVAADGSDLCMP